MKKSMILFFVCIVFSIHTISVFGQATLSSRVLSFEEAYQMMELRNPGILRKKEQIKQKEFEQKVSKSLRLPTVSLNAQAVTMSDPLHLDLTEVRDAILPLYTTLGNYGTFSDVPNPDPNTSPFMPILTDELSTQAVRGSLLGAADDIESANWDKIIQEKSYGLVSVGFVWPIYSGSKINGANKAAGVNLDISKEELRAEQGLMLTELVQRYYGLELGFQIVEVRKQMLVSMENHYSDTQKMYENGIVSKVELLHAEVSKNEAEREYKQALRNIEIIRTGLSATLANDSLNDLLLTSHLFINKDLGILSEWVGKAKQENPMLKQIQGKKELVSIMHKIERNEYLPSVAMIGNYNVIDKNYSPYAPDWVVGIGMKWTLFDGMARMNKIRASQTVYNQVEYAAQKANDDIEAYLTKLYQELYMLKEQKTALETTLELANEYARSTEKAFNEGLVNSTSVVEAHTKVAKVKAMRLKVLYDYELTLASFLQTSGIPEAFITFCRGENAILESL